MKVLALSILAALFAEVTAFGPTLPLVSTQCARRKPQFAMGRPAQVLLCMNRDGDSEEDENSEEEVVDWEYVYEEVEEEVYEYESDPDAPVGIPLRDVDWDQAWVHFKIMRTYESHAFAKNAGTIVAALAFLATVHFCECSSATFLSSYHTHFRMDTSSRHLCSDRALTISPVSLIADLVKTGGIVVLPDSGGLSMYNFAELQKMDPQQLMKLGLPMPAVPPPVTVFQRLQMFSFSGW